MNAERSRLDLAESVEVELPNEATEVVVLEELRNDLGGKRFWIFHHKSKAIVTPRGDGRIASINHGVGFCTKHDRLKADEGCVI
jgi:hypothetical protein